MRVLGIEIDEQLVDRWRAWLMPERQPFVVPRSEANARGWADGRRALSFEVLDAFELYGVDRDAESIVWLDAAEARSLPVELRKRQPTPHRWQSGDEAQDRSRAVRYVESGRRTSRHDEVPGEVWTECEGIVPGAREIAGTFPQRSGPNCFGAVMGAAGVTDAADEWMQMEPFEQWLAQVAVRGGEDDQAGTVLVWRTDEGTAAHAAVTLGGGWLLHKPSQGWMSPTKVLPVREGKFSARFPGRQLRRYRLVA